MKYFETSSGDEMMHYNADPEVVLKKIAHGPNNQEDSFYIFDVSDVVKKIKNWKLKLPRVKPFYAVKCNNNKNLLNLLASVDLGFDCASREEIKTILDLGVDSSRIIYANPCKQKSHLKYASSVGVNLMTFDNESELHKIKDLMPRARLVLRIRCDATVAQAPLGIKFGALPEDAEDLLMTAKQLKLNVVGVSFHVGSGCGEPAVFLRAIATSKMVFDQAIDLGFSPHLLDIGGGYPGDTGSSIDECAFYINKALDEHFPEGCGVDIIAEPGRYVASSAFTIATQIISKRENKSNGEAESIMYYVNDGVYGSFNCVLYDHQIVSPMILKDIKDDETCLPSSVFGPTCDGLDQILNETLLPVLEVGDWLVWKNMGAYTLASAGTFNGFPVPPVHTVIPRHTMIMMESSLGVSLDVL